MRGVAFDVLLFYVCLNLAIGFMASTGAIPGFNIQPASSSEQINFYSQALTYADITRIASIGVPGIIGALAAILMKHALLGVAILVLAAAGIFFPVVGTFLVGFPILMANLGVPTPIVVVLEVLTGLVWLAFFAEFLAGREVD